MFRSFSQVGPRISQQMEKRSLGSKGFPCQWKSAEHLERPNVCLSSLGSFLRAPLALEDVCAVGGSDLAVRQDPSCEEPDGKDQYGKPLA